MTEEQVREFAERLARRLVNRTSTSRAWDALNTALLAYESEFESIFGAAGQVSPLVLTRGDQTAHIVGPFDRRLDYWIDQSESAICLKNSWAANTVYKFRVNPQNEILTPVGAPYPGMDVSQSITAGNLVVTSVQSLLSRT